MGADLGGPEKTSARKMGAPVGCEKGLAGPFGPSAYDGVIAVEGVGMG